MTQMSIAVYTAKLSEKEEVNNKFIWFHFELINPNLLDFAAGQYILLDIPGVEAKKQYSIASEPQMNHAIELLVDITPGGEASTYFSQLEIGDDITFRAPVGVFTVSKEKTEEALVFVATGSGITPLRSMILDQLHTQKDTRPVKLFWGMRHAHEMFWEEDFYGIDQDYDNFSFEMILSKPPEDWHLSTGYVTDLLEGYQKNFDSAGFYICGGSKMIDSVREYLKSKSVPEEHIHTEKFF